RKGVVAYERHEAQAPSPSKPIIV
ncbi:unnamed protein product, partial [Rotaria socialis]